LNAGAYVYILREGELANRNSPETINISIDKSIKGHRGFIVRVIDIKDNGDLVEADLSKNYWPIKKNNITKSQWGPVHYTLGFQAWFDPERKEYDTDAIKNNCNNLLPNFICGVTTENTLVNVHRKEILDRGVDQLFYFPQAEQEFRR